MKCQLDATREFYLCVLSSTCFGYIRPSSGALDFELQHMVFCTKFLDGWWSWEPLYRSCVRSGWCCVTCTAPSAPYHHPFKKIGAENRTLQLNIWCSWWWAFVPETCWAKNTSIKLPCCIKLAFQIISLKMCT